MLDAADFARLVLEVCALSLPPGITVDRLRAIAQVESGLNPNAISAPNRNSTRDYGLLQINESNFARFGVNARTIMEPCTNLRVGVAILADADWQAGCIYNSGRPNCSGVYPDKIAAAAARQARTTSDALSRTPAAAPQPDPDAPPSWDVWAKPRPRPVAPIPREDQEAASPVVVTASRNGSSNQ
jgi:hypothetical protein